MNRKPEYYDAIRHSKKGKLYIDDVIRTEPKIGKIWRCVCECGNEIYLSTSQIKGSHYMSCPECSRKEQRERSRNQLYKHGLHGTRIYRIWREMICRCTCPSDTGYKHYGGRGISVCSDWTDPVKFATWAQMNGYSDDLTLDRIDVNGNYTPDNCRWISFAEQCFNKRTTHWVTVNGIRMPLVKWARYLGVNYSCICRAAHKAGGAEEYISKKLQEKDGHSKCK